MTRRAGGTGRGEAGDEAGGEAGDEEGGAAGHDGLDAIDLTPWLDLAPLPSELPPELFLRRTRRLPSQAPVRPADPREPELPALGTVLGTYRLEQTIGLGGFGAVYRARHVVLDTLVAIKLMRPSVARRRRTLPMMLQEEARLAARIDHPNVVRVLDVAASEAGTYIVMEYVDGPDLALLIERRGPVPAKMTLRILRHLVAALAAGLAAGVIHRDVKPSNILLHRDGVTKLVDFGLARSAGAGMQGAAGTPGYMAPEVQARPEAADPRSDIYSLGVTAIQALTGRADPPTRDPAAVAAGAARRAAEDLRAIAPAVPLELVHLVAAMVAPSPEDRPPTYAAIEAALAHARGRLG
jgi:serine/threonine protein kinase